MTTLTLDTDTVNGYVRLTITPTDEVTRVRRTDVNGTADVRTLTGQLPHPVVGGVLIMDDYEAGHGSARYTVTTAAGSVTGTIVHTLNGPWLGTPENPQFSVAVRSFTDYGASGQTLSTVHEPEGRNVPPIVIVRGASTRRGNMRIEGGAYPDALKILRIFQRGQTMLLRQPEHAGMDMYFIPMNFEIVTAAAWGKGSLFDVSLSYIEVGRPAGAMSGSLGWTWAELEAAFPTWAAVEEAYASWGDVRTDTRTP
jgi:hypothetical protein